MSLMLNLASGIYLIYISPCNCLIHESEDLDLALEFVNKKQEFGHESSLCSTLWLRTVV